MTSKKIAESIWFVVRWITGWLIDVVITFGAMTAMFWIFFFYLSNPLHGFPVIPDSWLSNPIIAFGVALGVFSAFMAGRQWVRAQYFTHILPEVWSDTVSAFIKNIKEQEKK